ncbi:MAG: hypothetical protein ACK52I_03600 [Pseudomonadota bacterium]|jgi:hypothetical protein
MAIGYKEQSAATVPIPGIGEQYTFIDTTDNKLKRKNSSNIVTTIEPVGSGVDSFNGRSGAIVPVAGDYSADLITNVPAGSIIGTDVQAAINQLDSEKAPLTHVSAGGVSQHPVASGVDAGFMSPSDKTKLDNLNRGVAGGIAELNGSGIVPASQLPSGILGSVQYQSAWNASINSPPLLSGIGTKGHYYVVSMAGSTALDTITDWQIGDWAIFNGTIWEKVDNTDKVASVNGQTGSVVLVKGDFGLGNVDNTSDLNKPISTATQAALDLKADATSAINQLTGEATAGPGSGSQAVTLSNAAVIGKVLTGLSETYGRILATDSILQALSKIAFNGDLHPVDVNVDMTIPAEYNLVRSKTRLNGTAAIFIGLNGMLKII